MADCAKREAKRDPADSGREDGFGAAKQVRAPLAAVAACSSSKSRFGFVGFDSDGCAIDHRERAGWPV